MPLPIDKDLPRHYISYISQGDLMIHPLSTKYDYAGFDTLCSKTTSFFDDDVEFFTDVMLVTSPIEVAIWSFISKTTTRKKIFGIF